MAKIILETERLLLREFEPADAGDVREMLADGVHSRRQEGFERFGRPLYLYSTRREDFQ